MRNSLTVIILSFNEEKHIERCLGNISQIADRILLVDSFSTDRTCKIAQSLGANMIQNPWVDHAIQFNWALDNLPIETEWTMRFDCD